jgi:hypothetical protein
MKLLILLFAIVFGFGATVKKSVDDKKELQKRIEVKSFVEYPNLLPEVEVFAKF